MRHLKDVYEFTGKQLASIFDKLHSDTKPIILDFGCGEGWILRIIREMQLGLRYVGLDFNAKFIDFLGNKHKGDSEAFFHCVDFEEPPPQHLIAVGDVGINFFNFFEIPNIEEAFKNVANMLKKRSYLLIVNIDPVMQILAVSNSEKEFITNLGLYERYGKQMGYDKDIDVGDLRSERIYKALLYSTATYVSIAQQNGFNLYDYKEVVKTANSVPQIYQYIFFRRE
jgi:SAM-dependent methyltransferase